MRRSQRKATKTAAVQALFFTKDKKHLRSTTDWSIAPLMRLAQRGGVCQLETEHSTDGARLFGHVLQRNSACALSLNCGSRSSATRRALSL